MTEHLSREDAAVGRFHAALRPLLTDDLAPELFPSKLSSAAADALSASGAGLSVFSERFRVPLGSSTEVSAAAERLQFTIAEGPCLYAINDHRTIRVDEDEIYRRWPAFHDALRAETPYRSVVAAPLTIASSVVAAFDVYFETPTMPAYSVVMEVTAIAKVIGELLSDTDDTDAVGRRWSGGELPDWAYGWQSRQRMRVWVAVGVVVATMEVDAGSALARLRAHAYANNEQVDALCDAIVEGRRSVHDLND